MRVTTKAEYWEKVFRRAQSRLRRLIEKHNRREVYRHPFLYNLQPKRPGGGLRGARSRLAKARRFMSRAKSIVALAGHASCEVIRGTPDAIGLGGVLLENKTL
jgi:hypothetical protein